jgi:tetratricopeptide (TPR) repeat protein
VRARLAGVLACALLAASARRAAAQLPAADSAFARGEYGRARQLYDSVLRADSLNRRALFQLAVLESWDGALDRALAHLATLRRVAPGDVAVMVEYAKVLAWARRFRWSAALYDSVLAVAPDRLDAQVGRARAVSWDGDLVRAERLWRDALAAHPDDPDILLGLAQTLYWEGQTYLAEGFAARAHVLAPQNRDAQDLVDRIRAQRGPVGTVSADAANDIYHNRMVAFAGALGASPLPDVRATLRAGWRQNDDGTRAPGTRTARSIGLDGLLEKSLPSGASLRAGVGARSLDPDTGAGRGVVTAQVGGLFHPAKTTSITAGYRRYPFDETTTLVERGLVFDEVNVDAELSPRSNLFLSAGANAAWLSDGNRRLIGSAGVMVGVARRLRAGAYARVMGWARDTLGRGVYFSPDRFTLGEARAVYVWWSGGWWLSATGGLGAQQVGSRGATQAEWHGDLIVTYNWRALDQLVAVASYTNSASASTATTTTPTYRYWSFGLRYRRGL